MPTTAQHIAARDDADLVRRFVAVAEMESVPGAQTWAEAHMGQLVNVEVADGQTVSQIHDYAVGQYQGRPRNDGSDRPGADPAIVTDAYLVTAVQAVRAEDATQGATA